jgi:hypothetical protein
MNYAMTAYSVPPRANRRAYRQQLISSADEVAGINQLMIWNWIGPWQTAG